MKIKYVKGNLLEAPEKFILHGCNMQGVMGSGVAKLIKEKYPSAFTQAQLEQWCADYGIESTMEVAPPEIYDGDIERLLAKVEHLTERPDTLCADVIDPSHPSEGIILRVDTGGMQPYFLKSKSFHFRTMEGLCEAVDTEDMEAA